MRVRAEGQEKALRKQKIQGQRASQENVARTATPTSVECAFSGFFRPLNHDCDMTKKNVLTLSLVNTTQSVVGYQVSLFDEITPRVSKSMKVMES